MAKKVREVAAESGPAEEIWEGIAAFRAKGISRVLILGCGTGRHLREIADCGFETYGSDVSPSALKFAGNLVPYVQLDRAELHELPYKDGFFGGIVCYRPLHFGDMRNVRKVVEEMTRVLKRNGMIFLRVPSDHDPETEFGSEIAPGTRKNVSAVYDGNVRHYFKESELRSLFKGFVIVSLTHGYHTNERRSSRMAASWTLLARRKKTASRTPARKKAK
jgi:SAM-dependent methyltransferase